jgi:hypothetical protein
VGGLACCLGVLPGGDVIFLCVGILPVAPGDALSETGHRGQRASVRVAARSALRDRFPSGTPQAVLSAESRAPSTGDAARGTRAASLGPGPGTRSPVPAIFAAKLFAALLAILGLAGAGLASLGLVGFPRARKIKPRRQTFLLPTSASPVATSVGNVPDTGPTKGRLYKKPVGEYLVEHGVVGRQDVAGALYEQRRTDSRFAMTKRCRRWSDHEPCRGSVGLVCMAVMLAWSTRHEVRSDRTDDSGPPPTRFQRRYLR